MNPDLNGVEMIQAERGRQTGPLGYDEAHDDEHTEGELALAAICYAAPNRVFVLAQNDEDVVIFEDPWPWSEDEDNRRDAGTGTLLSNRIDQHQTIEDRIDQLAQAGALIAAEIDRLLRVRETKL